MKEKKTRKAPTPAEQIALTRVSIVIWSILFVIWIGLGIAKTVEGDDWWLIALDYFVGVLSGVDAILSAIRLKRLKKADVGEKTEEESENE